MPESRSPPTNVGTWLSSSGRVARPCGAAHRGERVHTDAPSWCWRPSRPRRSAFRDRGRVGRRTMPRARSGRRGDPALARGRSFFARVTVTRKEAPERRYCHRGPLSRQHRSQFGKGDVRRHLMRPPDPRRARLGLCRARIAALGLGGGLAMVAMKRRPPHRAGRAHPEAPRRGTTRHASRNGTNHPIAQIIDKGLPICPAPVPEARLNQTSARLGILNDSRRAETALVI